MRLATPSGASIPVEERDAREVTTVGGTRIAPCGTEALNRAFDVTPARLVTGFITERGIAAASRDGLYSLYPERRETAA